MGVGTLVGPAAGGVFAQLGLWRWAFGALAMFSAVMAILVPGVLSKGRCERSGPSSVMAIPVWSVVLLGAAALTVSIASVPHNVVATAVMLAVGAVLVASFVVVDRRMSASVLPPSVFGLGPLKWIYLSLGLMMAVTKVDMYVPLFGQRLAHLVPVVAGFLGAALSIGWTVSEIASASLNRARVVARVVTAAPLVMATSLALAGLVHVNSARLGGIVLWGLALLGIGAGIGVAWPHLSAWVMARVDDPAEGGAAAAAITTVQLISGAFGAGLAGVVVNVIDGGRIVSVRWAFVVFAVLAATGVLATYRASRSRPSSATVDIARL